MILTFENCPIILNGVSLFASNGEIQTSRGLIRKEWLGAQQVDTVNNSRPVGSMRATIYLDDTVDPYIRNLTGTSPITGKVGEWGFASGFLTSYSFAAEPSQLIEAQVSIDFFSSVTTGSVGASPSGGFEFAHGGFSAPSGMSFNTGLFSFRYDLTQSFTPYHKLGDKTLLGVDRTDGSIKCSLEGSGLQDALPTGFCEDEENIVLNLKTLCNDAVGTISISGMKMASAKISTDSQKDIVGSVELVRFF